MKTIKYILLLCFVTGIISAQSTRPQYENGYWLPYLSAKPLYYWNVLGGYSNSQKNLLDNKDPNSGLRNHLLMQSMAGLTARAVQQGKSKVVIWMGGNETSGYLVSLQALKTMGMKCIGDISAQELATKSFNDIQGVKVTVKDLFDGYVLTDLANNLESNNVASVASHVYNSIIVDVKDKAIFDAAGYKMTYDARRKNISDAWREFKDKCKNNAIVVMPNHTGELREFAIANGLFVVNVMKDTKNASKETNIPLMEEIFKWLQPGAPMYGADNRIDEGEQAAFYSVYASHWVPYDWGYNTTLTSLNYPDRQNFEGAKSIDPRKINYKANKNKKIVSYYISDGDNVQWAMNNILKWYNHPQNTSQKITLGLPIGNLEMIGPAQLEQLFKTQQDNTAIFERGSYYFIDIYADKKGDKAAAIKQMAQMQAQQMKRHNVKILGVVSRKDIDSPASMEFMKALVEANDQLEGIITIQYSPYADGKGRLFWFKNSKGIEIPAVATKYSLWNIKNSDKIGKNNTYEGSPAYITAKLKAETEETSKFSLICIHSWSKFYDKGKTEDTTAEIIINDREVDWNAPGVVFGAGIAELMSRRLDKSYQIVNVQELIWRIRMDHNPKQTKAILKNYKP